MATPQEPTRLRPYHGLAIFAIVMLTLLLVAAPIQQAWGLYGVAVTELILLAFALVPAIILKTDLRTVFPVRKPSLRQVFGVLTLWAGSYLAVLIITLITAYFFLEEIFEVSRDIQNVFTSVPMVIAFFIVAVMPAICEEVLHRGLILASFRAIRNKWIIVLSIGILFGIFHLDPYRFLPTAVLGMAIAYIMVETENLILPMLFHFINNALTTLVSFATRSQGLSVRYQALPEGLDPKTMRMAIGSYLIIGAVFPYLMLAGSRLLHEKASPGDPENDAENPGTDRRIITKGVVIAFLASGLLFGTGVAILALNFSS